MTLLGINIDHVATLRQARRESFPDPVQAALAAVQAGADSITAHLREDRRHINDDDVMRLKKKLSVPLNLEMGATDEILQIAEKVRPPWVCLVPEKREELTTEGGLDVRSQAGKLKKAIERLHQVGSNVSLFVEPDVTLMSICHTLNCDAVELHTGTYAKKQKLGEEEGLKELQRLAEAAKAAEREGMIVNAGHGLDYENVSELLKQFPFHEFNIGFSIIARSVFVGMTLAVKEMKEKMNLVCAAS